MQPTFQQTFMIPGTQAADHIFAFAAPFGMTLVHVSMSNKSANAGTLDLGEAADADGWADGKTMGVSYAITELDAYSEFDGATAGGQYPHLDRGRCLSRHHQRPWLPHGECHCRPHLDA